MTTPKTTTAKLVRTPRTPRITRTPKTIAPVPTDMASAMRIAATVTPDNFGAMLAAANANHGVTHGSRNVNRFDSTRIEHTQNRTFTDNVTAQLTDVQLAFVWCVAFPVATGRVFDPNRATSPDTMRTAIATSAGIVGGARRTFNAGKHGAPAPAVASVRYGGRPVFTTVTPVKTA